MTLTYLEQSAKTATTLLKAKPENWEAIATQFGLEKGWSWWESPEAPYNVGNLRDTQGNFRTFATLEDGVQAYVDFLTVDDPAGYYKGIVSALQTGTVADVLTALSKSPFCSPPYPLATLEGVYKELQSYIAPVVTVTEPPYPAETAQLNGKTVQSVSVHGVTYLIWTVAKTLGLDVTKADLGDVEIADKKPTQVVQDQNTYILWSSFPVTAQPLSGGGFNFVTKPTNSYAWTVTEKDTAVAGTWANVSVQTLDNGKPLANQSVEFYVNGVIVATNPTSSTGLTDWDISETTNKTDTVLVQWTDPAGVVHKSTHTTAFAVPAASTTPIPSDDSVVVQFPILPSSDASDAVYFDAQTTTGQTVQFQLDTGAFELMLTTATAATFAAPNLGATSIAGVGGSASAYLSEITVVINGTNGPVTFSNISCTVDTEFTGYPLFGYKFFIDNGYDLLVSQKHNTVTIMKAA